MKQILFNNGDKHNFLCDLVPPAERFIMKYTF